MFGDYYDSGYDAAGCAAKGWTEGQCRVGSLHYFDYYFAYSGVKNLTLSANVRNVFNTRTPVSLRGFLAGGGGIIPQDIFDVMGRMLRVTVEYKFR